MKQSTAAIICTILLGCGSASSAFELLVEKVRPHPILGDHERILIVMLDGRKFDSVILYPDPGAGAPLHYVEFGSEIIAVDCNGVWYKVTWNGIANLGWQWGAPLPHGVITKVSLNTHGQYVKTTVKEVKLSDVYVYKDPP